MPVIVNRAPVLTLWATVVAERLAHPPDTALTLGRSVAGSAARVKARNIGREERKADRDADMARLREEPVTAPVLLLGKTIRLLPNNDGELRAADGDSRPIRLAWNAVWPKPSVITWRTSGQRWRRLPAAMTRWNSTASAFGCMRRSGRRSRRATKDGARRRCWTLERS